MVVICARDSWYTKNQLHRYLETIGCSELSDRPPTFESLEAIIRRHLCTIPWENSEMHYTETGDMDTTPAGVYKRTIIDRTGGSFCFGQNTLLLGMLRAIGYRVYSCVARVNGHPEDTGLDLTPRVHMVLLVQLPNVSGAAPLTWAADVGFGQGLVRPIPLDDGAEVAGAVPPVKHRLALVYDSETSLDTSDPKSASLAEEWSLQVNQGSGGVILPEGQWRTLYHFTLHERHQRDLQSLSFGVTRRPSNGILWNNLLAVKYFPEEGSNLGMRVLFGEKLTERGSGYFKVLQVFSTEVERVDALVKYFGIVHPTEGVSYVGRANGALKKAAE